MDGLAASTQRPKDRNPRVTSAWVDQEPCRSGTGGGALCANDVPRQAKMALGTEFTKMAVTDKMLRVIQESANCDMNRDGSIRGLAPSNGGPCHPSICPRNRRREMSAYVSVTIPLQHNGMVEASAIGAAMQNLYDAAMENGFGPGAAISGRSDGKTLVVTIEHGAAPVIAAPRRGRPPKNASTSA